MAQQRPEATRSARRRAAAAIFTAREDLNTLLKTLRAVLAGCQPLDDLWVDVLVNGNSVLANSILKRKDEITGGRAVVRIWFMEYADKAEAWNKYVQQIFPGADYAIFVDGYAEIDRDSIQKMLAAHESQPEALAISGIQRLGPSARRLQKVQLCRGGLSGNLYMLPYETMRRLKDSAFRLPSGLYRTDSTLGAALHLNLDPETSDWDLRRVITVPEASFTYRTPRFWRVADWHALAKRTMRQARGVLENRAVRDHFRIRRRPASELPETAHELVLAWHTANPSEARSLFARNILTWLAYRRYKTDPPPLGRSIEPKLLAQWHFV